MRKNNLLICKKLGLEIPIIQAPMAGGITTPELVAAVSNAGALGSLGAAYLSPDEIRKTIREIKGLTKRPFNVNIFIPEKKDQNEDPSSVLDLLQAFWKELSDKPFTIPPSSFPAFDLQAEVILEEKVPVFSFTFGILSTEWIERFKKQGTFVIGTASTPEEALQLEQAGVDAIVCQGYEAGGHRACFSSYDSLLGLSVLLSLTRKKVKLPLIAAGGIMDAEGILSSFLLGADAAQLGTAFLTTNESGAAPSYKNTLLQPPYLPTCITNVFSGKPARAIVNHFIHVLEGHHIPSFPFQQQLTSELRKLAASQGQTGLMSLYAGQGYPLCKKISATSLINELKKQIV